MTNEQSLKIKELAIKYYNEGMTDLHMVREKIQYDGETDFWDKEVFFTNDEVYNLVLEAIASIQPIEETPIV